MKQNGSVRPASISRRTLFHALSIGSVGAALAGRVPVNAMQEPVRAQPSALAPLNRFPRMVQEFFVERENEVHQQRLKRLAALTTKADAEAYVRAVREKIRDSFGPLPEKTPLNPRVTKVVERDAYKIENVLFESRPGFLVSANLYVPKGRTLPAAGRRGLVRALGQRQGDRDLSILLPGAGAAGLRGADLRSDRPGRTACSTWTRTGSRCAGREPPSTTTPASSRCSSTSDSARGARGTASVRSTT